MVRDELGEQFASAHEVRARTTRVFIASPLMSIPAQASAHVVALPVAVMPTISASTRRMPASLPTNTADNIVWGTLSEDDTIVRGASLDDNPIVWGSSLAADTLGCRASLNSTL